MILPGTAEWKALVPRLLSACGGAAKWRVALSDGTRIGPIPASEMGGWLLQGRVPGEVVKGAGGAAGTKAGAELAVCAIAPKDYSTQKLPGLRFYKPVGGLLGPGEGLPGERVERGAVGGRRRQRGGPASAARRRRRRCDCSQRPHQPLLAPCSSERLQRCDSCCSLLNQKLCHQQLSSCLDGHPC